MTPTQRAAALRLADDLEYENQKVSHDAADLLRELAAEPVQEPECQYAKDVGMPEYRCAVKCQYAAPQQRKPLTNEQIAALLAWDDYLGGCITLFDFARAIEEAHGVTGEPT